jgi:ketosteroid isomerase-like protein
LARLSGRRKNFVFQQPVSGDLAVVTGVVSWKEAKSAGQEHYTLILRAVDGKWMATAEHISAVKKP